MVLTSSAVGCSTPDDEREASDVAQAQPLTWPETCFDPQPGTCDFYRNCLEQKFSCGEDGYPLGYGEKYCHAFLGHSGFSPAAARWRDSTLSCLQRSLVGYMSYSVVPENPMCNTIDTDAFDSHPSCYTTPGASICDLKAGDWWDIQGVIDTIDLISPKGAVQFFATLKTCASDWVGLRAELETSAVADAARRASINDLNRRLTILSSSSTVDEFRIALAKDHALHEASESISSQEEE